MKITGSMEMEIGRLIHSADWLVRNAGKPDRTGDCVVFGMHIDDLQKALGRLKATGFESGFWAWRNEESQGKGGAA